ncbi:hypothetical protein GGF50DRAFT_60010, partial [Schizophyllum commune]
IRARWTPMHEGMAGNEAVDALAKETAGGFLSPKVELPKLLRQQLNWSKAALRKTYE